MGACEEIRERLKAACTAHYSRVFMQDDSYGTRKFVRKGILAAESAIDSVPPGHDPRSYLDALKAAVGQAADELRRDPDDEDHWGPGGANTILQEVEKERARLSAGPEGV